MRTKRISSFVFLAAGIVAISFGAIFARLADAPAPVVAALRLGFSALLCLPAALASARTRRELRCLSGRGWAAIALAGIFCALHFTLWISSLSHTGVASSVVLVTTSPLWVGLYALLVLRERVRRSFWIGLALAIVGVFVIGGGDMISGSSRFMGDMLAMGGAIAIAGYFLVGSALRRRLSIVAYVFPVYSIAAVVLIVVVFLSRMRFSGYSQGTYLYCFLMALVCQVIGHSLFNWALRYLPATSVTVATLGEPVGASVLAYCILREFPAVSAVAGGALILGGILTVLTLTPELAPTRPEDASVG
jgi:drug/metabolite transporter (DMT)-like permease